MRTACTSRQILTKYTQYDVFLRKNVPLGGRIDVAPRFGGQMAPKTHILVA